MLFFCRAVERNLLQFSCTLLIKGDILRNENCVPYKYYVTTEMERPYEFLHGIKSYYRNDVVNRCLQIPAQSFKYGGEIQKL